MNPGELLMKMLYRGGCTVHKFRQLLEAAQTVRPIYYRPHSKVAILIANDKYTYLSKLATPSIDCDSLSSNLKDLGFIVVTVKNTTSCKLREILSKIMQQIPEDSYCFIFYAGHGCEIVNTKCILGIDCPMEDIELEHCITENFVLENVYKCKPDLCVLIMDMCRINLNRNANPQIYKSISTVESYDVHNNLLIGYSTQSAQAAYEVLQIECTTTIDETYELKTGDSARIVPGGSQYVNALCTRLGESLDVNSLLDTVHGDVELSMKKQRPIKVQWGVEKRSLYDPATGSEVDLLNSIKELTNDYKDNCNAF
ncbi:mucosa-associated lymphoid tissue lymphoma translocation protein 1 [Aphomia sociella]